MVGVISFGPVLAALGAAHLVRAHPGCTDSLLDIQTSASTSITYGTAQTMYGDDFWLGPLSSCVTTAAIVKVYSADPNDLVAQENLSGAAVLQTLTCTVQGDATGQSLQTWNVPPYVNLTGSGTDPSAVAAPGVTLTCNP